MRMETSALFIGSALFEKLGIFDPEFLKKFLYAIFTSLHFYRNSTKNKTIPIPIIKSIHTFFATFMINNGSEALVAACDTI
jgi:hypothetical protein